MSFASACAEDGLAMAELADVCGVDGPAQILPLETDEVVNPTFYLPER
ncbi:MAG: hypothetical protein IAG13_27275, partial [Deltaproteobacteria bacterium]|nr:hypothetical protein [Nannocystaceae bacterium]